MNSSSQHQLIEAAIAEHLRCVQALNASIPVITRIIDEMADCVRRRGKIVIFGNGGSAADAQHIATELTVRYRKNRRALAALSLVTDTSALTAAGNDFDFSQIFSRQVEALCAPSDIAWGISTSGASKNVLEGLREAKKIGCMTILFTGEKQGVCEEFADVVFSAPSTTTARIQECHLLAGHMICEALDELFD